MRINKLLCACLAALLLIACGESALAKVPSPSKEFYYLDQANVLSEATEGEIFFANQLLEDACGAQIVVVTVKSIGNEAIDDYTGELFNSWGIGDAKKQNGFLLLLAIDDDYYYAECGTNLQPNFTSGAIKDYYDKYLETDFAAKRYDAGVKKFFEAVFARVADTYNAEVSVDDGIAAYKAWAASANPSPMSARSGGGSLTEGGYTDDEDTDFTGAILGVLIVIVLIVILTRTSRRRRVARHMFVAPPPPPPTAGPGGYRGVNNMPGAGGYRGPTQTPLQSSRRGSDDEWLMRGLMHGLFRSSGGGFHSSGSSRSSSSFRSSSSHSSGSRSFGSARGGGGGSRGGGAGRGRH